ncbi:Rossmann-like domain-containing protein [Kitasatospora herbaricolor]|uniref:Rossmann-like domain-containing protein n=1 Tax=Kitasatospora herbaricolor TaxID=68217 RepID=UPI0036DCAF9C
MTYLDELIARATDGAYGIDPARHCITVAFTTTQSVRHDSRTGGYRNEALSLRLGAAVGSCSIEPGAIPATTLDECVGATVAELLAHPSLVVRVATLDALLMHAHPHAPANGAQPYPLPGGSSIAKSRARAKAVVELLPLERVRRVLVVGVVNSLLEQLRDHGVDYLACDLKGGQTEWDEPVQTDAMSQLPYCDALLVSGMTLGNGTFDALLDHARDNGKPLVTFAQTGSAVLPQFLGHGVSAVCAEPYPFFWLDGGPGTIYRYGGAR